ncbi:GDSL-type esterase/lipase family protein [Acinetobacter sp. GN11]
MDEMLDPVDIANVKIDLEHIGEGGNEDKVVTPRYGIPFKSLPMVSRLGQEGFAAAIQKIENMGGYVSAASLTELNTRTPTFNYQLARVQDTGDEYFWDPSATPSPAWKPTGKNWLNAAKDFANANAMFKPKTYASAVDCNTLVALGWHTFLSGAAWDNSTNRPNRTAQYAHILVLPTTANIITQIAIMGNNTKSFAMRLRNDLLVWQDWLYFYSFDEMVSLIKADFNSYLKPLKTSSTANLLDPAQVIQNFEVRPDGTILASATGAISGLIYCYNKEYLYVSGLQANTGPRYYRFLDQNGIFVSGGYLNNGIVEGLITVPKNAYSFQLSLKQGNSNPLDISTAQIEFGTAKTAYVAFAAGAITHLNQVALADTPVQFNSTSSSKNLFDKSAVLNGFEVYNDGSILAQVQSITSAVIDVSGMSNITISGLVQNPEIVRYCVFKDSAGIRTVLWIDKTETHATFAVPANAISFQFSIKQRSTSTPDLNIVQVESGIKATSYVPFVRGISSINGLQIVSRISGGSSSGMISRAIGAIGYFAGDSRVVTSNVEAGDYTSTSFVSNYPKFMKDTLKLSGFKNLARSGASFAETTDAQLQWQKMRHQVQTMIDILGNPDFILLDAGTNDMNWDRANMAMPVPVSTLGSYEVAMGKPIADLNPKLTAESMRWCLHKIREAFPNAVCFYATQTQRADTDPVYQEISNNVMVKLARRYGFTIIDGLYGFEIIKDFEVWKQNPTDPDAGRFLKDGLHPNLAGQQVMNNFYSSQIIQRMTY